MGVTLHTREQMLPFEHYSSGQHLLMFTSLIAVLISSRSRNLESLAHLLKCSRVNLPTCVSLLQYLQGCWPALHSTRWWMHLRNVASIQPADERPDEHYDHHNPA